MNLSRLLFMAFIITVLHLHSICAQSLQTSKTTSFTRDDAISLFSKANDVYESGEHKEKAKDHVGAKKDYEQAAQFYERILLNGFKNWQVFYNLGNVYYRLNQLGKAILNYRRALLLAPRREEVKFNLQQAKRDIRDKENLSHPPAFVQTPLFFYYFLNINEATILAVVMYITSCLCLCLFIFLKAKWLKMLSIFCGVCLVILFVSLAVKIANEQYTQRGVVLAKKCAVRWAPGQENTMHFEVHEGAEFIVEKQKDNWYKAKFFVKIKGNNESNTLDEENENSQEEAVGWIASKDVAIIQPI